MDLSQVSLIYFILENELKTEDGKPYELKKHKFLYDILSDWHPKQVWYKAAQVGGTLAATLKLLFAVKNFKLNAIYTMPSASDASTLVKSKINRLVNNNPVMKDWISGDSVQEKQIGDNMAYFRGTFTEQQAISIPADLLIHDEEDRSKRDIIDTYRSRIDASEHGWEWHFSNPSVLGNGVSRYWAKSDQREWFITCGACEKKQYMKFPESICFERQVFQCRHCGAEITDEMRCEGKWVQRYKDRDWHGYHISQLIVPWKSAKDIIQVYNDKPLDYFYNFVLGLPYVGEGNKLMREQFFQNMTTPIEKHENIVIGCDSGIRKHFVVGSTRGLMTYGVTEDWSDIARLLVKYKNAIAVIDSMPDITGPRELREKFPNRVFLAHYFQGGKSMQLVKWGKSDEAGRVLVDRNRLLQFLVDEFTMKRIPVYGREDEWEDYFAHWDTLYRIMEENAQGNLKIKWESSNGNDHWALATAYWRAGMEKAMKGDTSVIGDKTAFGFKPAAEDLLIGKNIVKRPKKKYDWRRV